MGIGIEISKKLYRELIRELDQNKLFIDFLTTELEQNHRLKLLQGEALEVHKNKELNRSRVFLQSAVFLAVLLLILTALLLTIIRLKISYDIPSNTQIIAFLPEECVAELGILIKRMKKENASPWEIRLRLMTELLYLFWALYIQIQLENLWLPSQDHEIDE